MLESRLNRKMIFIFIVAIIALIIATLIARINYKRQGDIYKISSNLQIHGLVLQKPRVLKDFDLITDLGQSFTKEDLLGRWTLMFFGFTHCQSVCPTTLIELKKMLEQLKQKLPARLLPRVVMVSVDPERDSSQVMHKYLKSFSPDFVGVRANYKNLTALTQQMDVSFVKAAPKENNYMINHTSEIMLIDPNGDLRAFFSFPPKASTLANEYELMMKSIQMPS